VTASLLLVSHALCPYVQRVAIVLAEKGMSFERREVDLANKPGWFHAISPLGKTPVLVVNGMSIFESAVICEYLDDSEPPRLHPADPLERARHRAWMAFGSALLDQIAALYNAPTHDALVERSRALRARFAQVEGELATGAFFAGEKFSIVDAVFAPIFRYFDVLDSLGVDTLLGLSRIARWRSRLAERPSVALAVGGDYNERLLDFIVRRQSALSRRAEGLTRPMLEPPSTVRLIGAP
jgi:glutathione S-transferase